MFAKHRIAVIWLLSAALVAAFSPTPLAEARGGGGGGGGHGGGGFGGGGFGGGHMGGGGFGGGHFGGGFSGGHVGGWSGGHAMYAPHGFSNVGPSMISPNRGNFQSFAGRAGTFNRGTGNFNHAYAGNNGVWNHNEGWWNHRGLYGNGFFGYGIGGWPWYALGWGSGWWPDYYDYGYAPYGDLYGGYYDTGVAPYVSDSGVAPSVNANLAGTVIETGPPETGSEASDYYSQGLASFQSGDYGNATRLAGHAAIDDPRNPDVHILAMLGLFAMGEYRGAAMEAHAVAAMGGIPDWPTLYGFYENVQPYTQQLRKLEKFVGQHPAAAEGRFLLGFQYMMEGYKDVAKDQLAEAVKLTPRDTLAAKLLVKEGGTVPTRGAAAGHHTARSERGSQEPDAAAVVIRDAGTTAKAAAWTTMGVGPARGGAAVVAVSIRSPTTDAADGSCLARGPGGNRSCRRASSGIGPIVRRGTPGRPCGAAALRSTKPRAVPSRSCWN